MLDKSWFASLTRLVLYSRGVLAEKNILACEDGQVTFRDTENSGATQTRTPAGAEFLRLLLQHVLPQFRRTRDYRFLHGNCKRLIQRLHLLPTRECMPKPKEKPPLCCRQCGGAVTFTVIPHPLNRKPPDGPQVADLELPG